MADKWNRFNRKEKKNKQQINFNLCKSFDYYYIRKWLKVSRHLRELNDFSAYCSGWNRQITEEKGEKIK